MCYSGQQNFTMTGLQDAAHPANQTHNPQLHTRPTTGALCFKPDPTLTWSHATNSRR